MIVKNEQQHLPGCLASIRAVTDELVIVDTGSTDRSKQIARQHGAVLIDHRWTGDFAQARNVGLAAAHGQYILYIDADEQLVEQDAAPLRSALESQQYDAIDLSIVSPIHGSDKTNIVRYLRVFRNFPDLRFRHRIHEQIWPALQRHNPRVLRSDYRILHHGYNQHESVLLEKRTRNLRSALEVLQTEPDDPFYLYHAGLGHLTLDQAADAIPLLERAAEHTPAAIAKAPVLNALAQAHFDIEQRQQAEKHLRESTLLCPTQYHGWAMLADIYLRSDRHREAIDALQSCLGVKTSELHTDICPDRAVLFMKLGLAQLLTGKAQLALNNLETCLAGDLPTAEQRATAERYLALARRMSHAPS
jgi:tetratricopeptide (TPR) repeat protein